MRPEWSARSERSAAIRRERNVYSRYSRGSNVTKKNRRGMSDSRDDKRDGNPTLIAAERLDIAGQERKENLNQPGNASIKGRTPSRPFS